MNILLILYLGIIISLSSEIIRNKKFPHRSDSETVWEFWAFKDYRLPPPGLLSVGLN